MSILEEISQSIQDGADERVKQLVQKALDDDINAEVILNDGLLKGMGVIGGKFTRDEVYIPDVLVAARAMAVGTELLKPLLVNSETRVVGKVVLGTVSGDLHGIGKGIVGIMMEARGLEVIDIGVDASAEKFIETARSEDAQIIACSALLTTTMGEMKGVVELAKKTGMREKVGIMIGGAPVNDAFCKSIGADVYAPDGASAAEEAYKICTQEA